MAMSVNQKKAVIVATAGVALGVGIYYLLATRHAKKVKRRPSVISVVANTPVVQSESLDKEPEVEKQVIRPVSQFQEQEQPQEQTEPPRDAEVGVPAIGVGLLGNESPTSSFVTVEKEDCHGDERDDVGKDRSEPLGGLGGLVADENYFESFSQTDTVVRIKAEKDDLEAASAVTNVGDSGLNIDSEPLSGTKTPDAAYVAVADTSVSVAETVLDSMIDSITFDSPSLSEINTLGKHDLTWVPENDVDDVFSGEISTLREDDDTIWSHSVTETASSSFAPRGNFSLVGKVVEEDDEAEESTEQQVVGSSPKVSGEKTNVLGTEDATKF